ncbi:unnamed protein product [Auanema sp. JU1783]|nr:unnamed protein product [Auanema sp. JU1783]
MSTPVVPPVPKPRTRLNIVKSVKPELPENSQNEEKTFIHNNTEERLPGVKVETQHKNDESGDNVYDEVPIEYNLAKAPDRPAPPPPRPPSIGWMINVEVPKSPTSPQVMKSSSSCESNESVYQNSNTPSPPIYAVSSKTNIQMNDSTGSKIRLSDIVPLQSKIEKGKSRPIENNGYMSLLEFRALENDFIRKRDSKQPCEGERRSYGIHSPNFDVKNSDSRESIRTPPLPSLDFDLQSLNLVDSKPNQNHYTLAPTRSSDFRMSDSGTIDERPISLQESNIMEIEGTSISFFGFVTIHVGKKEKKTAHARLKNMNISFHEDDETNDLLSGPFHISGCQLIYREEDVIFIRFNEMETQKSITFTVEDQAETWSYLLGECWISDHSILKGSVKAATACGIVWLRQGSATEWQQAYCSFAEKSLQYMLRDEPENSYELDLRKILAVREKVEKNQSCPQIKKKSRGAFMLTVEGCSLYVECEDELCTTKWFDCLNKAINATPSKLDEYRLTSDNVPMIVDKCIRFISAFGMNSVGIYRRNGKISEAKDIMNKLLEDPAGTHLLPSTDETVYAVADVLRQFFRKLPTPLIPTDIHSMLFEAVPNAVQERVESFRRIIHTLPPVYFSTLRKLMAHLKEVAGNCGDNKASFDNLAKVFGPSLFHTDAESGQICFKDNSKQIWVIATLILEFDKIFEITMREEISRVLLDSKKTATHNQKGRAKGLLVPIHLWEKDNLPFNVQSDLAAEEVCREAVAKRSFNKKLDGKYAVYEVIRDSNLKRKMGPAERVSDVVINRWIPWMLTDGYLLFDNEDNCDEDMNMIASTGKVKLAEPGSKTFKTCELKIEHGVRLIAMKGEKNWKEWDLHSLIWFSGAETSRKAPYPNSATFFEVKDTNAREKLPGFCVCFKQISERSRFLFTVNFIQTGGKPAPLVHI